MKDLQHPNLLRMIACHFSAQQMFLVTELASNGTLGDVIRSDNMNLSLNNRLLHMLSGICSALNFLHYKDQPIIHRDIKPDNILVRDNFTVLLSDFGESKTLDGYV